MCVFTFGGAAAGGVAVEAAVVVVGAGRVALVAGLEAVRVRGR